MPGVDQTTGEASPVVPRLLAGFRTAPGGVMFGVNAIVTAGAGATLDAGAPVEVVLS